VRLVKSLSRTKVVRFYSQFKDLLKLAGRLRDLPPVGGQGVANKTATLATKGKEINE